MTGGNGGSGNSQQASGATSISSTGMTVGGSATCLIVMITWQAPSSDVTPTSRSVTWNGVAMTEQVFVHSTGSTAQSVGIYSLVNPATGNKTLAASWTNTLDCYMSAVSFTGTDTTTPVVTAHNTSNTNATSITVTSTTTGATVAASSKDAGNPTMTQTAIWANSPFSQGSGGSYAIGGTSNNHSFTYTGGTAAAQAQAGVHIQAPATTNTDPPFNLYQPNPQNWSTIVSV